MARYCTKCGGLLVQGTDTCIICGKTIAHEETLVYKTESDHIYSSKPPSSGSSQHMRIVTHPNVNPKSIPNAAPIPPFRSSGTLPGPQIRFVTAPGGRRIEGSSIARSYKTT